MKTKGYKISMMVSALMIILNRIEYIYILQILFCTRMWNKLSQNYLKTIIYNKPHSLSLLLQHS